MTTKAVVLGAGTFGQVVSAYLTDSGYDVIGFLDDAPPSGQEPVLGTLLDADTVLSVAGAVAFCAIGNPKVRLEAVTHHTAAGVRFPTWVHESATVPVSVPLGDGTLVLPGARVMPLSTVGRAVFLSMGSNVAHHSHVGDGTLVSTGVNIGAGVSLGLRVFCGIGSTVMTGVRSVGDDAVIGAGACVVRDVPPGVTVRGVPARQ